MKLKRLHRYKIWLVMPVLACILIGSFTLGAKPASACSCAGDASFSDKLKHADAVFSGEVKAIRPALFSSEWNAEEVTFDVQQAWSDQVHKRMAVETSRDSASCGFGFEKGKSYLVYAAYDDRGALLTHLCSGNDQIGNAKAAADLAQLNAQATSYPLKMGSNAWLHGYRLYAFMVLVILLGLGIALWVYRYRRRNR